MEITVTTLGIVAIVLCIGVGIGILVASVLRKDETFAVVLQKYVEVEKKCQAAVTRSESAAIISDRARAIAEDARAVSERIKDLEDEFENVQEHFSKLREEQQRLFKRTDYLKRKTKAPIHVHVTTDTANKEDAKQNAEDEENNKQEPTH